ncbi:MAG: hypothetical protein K5945_08450 [Bacteroidaceae bacterium]|nr:hypothetical protein [Bacteroidaceae bacterium]
MRKTGTIIGLLFCLTSMGQGYKVYRSDGKVDAYPGEMVSTVTLNDDSLHYEGHEYVDLGLPSGTRWATANIGAEKSHQNGAHYTFQRAEAEGLWGGDWRLPGIAEYEELLRTCQWEWTKVVNCQGYMVTGPNGNQLFLPAAGYITIDGSLVGALGGQTAGYWTSEGRSFAFSADTKGLAGANKSLQLSIRAVIGGVALPDKRADVLKEESHDYVDLGLSVLWATTNIGAAAPGDFGDYFGPCMTEPKPAKDMTYYEWESWNSSHSPYWENNYRISGYMDRYYRQAGREDEFQAWNIQYLLCQRRGLNEMDYWILPEHDAATVLWGDGWRMPTLSEYKELIENTTKTSSGSNLVFTSPNGVSLSFPKAGYYYNSNFNSGSTEYYTSSITDEYPAVVDLSRKPIQHNGYYSEYFCPIRPVKDRPKTGLTDEPTTARQEMVDLGLSVLWANCNWGAATPQEKGEYAAWGETYPRALYTESSYSQAGYPAQGMPKMLGKVGWTVPTAANVQELIDKCTWAREAEGYRVTGPNGNSIFMPFTGFREGSSLSYPNELGFYWTSDSAQALRIDNAGTPTVKEATGYFGMAIRPVMSPLVPETGTAEADWHSATVTCKAKGSYTEFGIQLCSIEYMDNAQSGAWRVPADPASLQGGQYTTYTLLQPNMPYFYRAYAVTEDGTTLYGDIKQLHTTADVEAVDLGLSVKWAPTNLGGLSEYDALDWYRHPSEIIGSAGQLPPTLSGSWRGTFIQTTWGAEWRLPTEAEFRELLSKCQWEWQEGSCDDLSTNSVNPENRNGYKVTGPNGHSIFLPANGIGAGMMMPSGTGTIGFYWTQTPTEEHAGCYNMLKFTATDKKISFGTAYAEYNIRPVKK